MTGESIDATITIPAPAEAVFAVLADPSRHPAIDGTGWLVEAVEAEPLTAAGQVFRMDMYLQAQDRHYRMVNRVKDFDAPHVISWEPGQDAGDAEPRYGGWVWRYDLAPAGSAETQVTLTYDWSGAGEEVRSRIPFPPFPPAYLDSSLAHLASVVTS